MRDMELELESEYELESLGESEFESEFETLGESEGAFGEGELEFENFGDGESENEQFLGPVLSGVGSLLGLGESEAETLGEFEGEQFFGKAFKRIGGFIKQNAPLFKQLGQAAAPIVGAAIGGPLGSKIGNIASNVIGQLESESEYESESEAEFEAIHEGPLSEQQALGELMAAAASKAATDMEAEAQIGSATVITLSAADRDALRAVLPSINRGVAVLTRILRRRPKTRAAVRAIPTIVQRSAVTLRKQAAAGRPVTKQAAARAVATQTRKVLSNPVTCAKAIRRNVKGTAQAAKSSARAVQRAPRPRYSI